MPFTFFAHQAPLMGLVSRPSRRIDGLALMVGSMAPDLVVVSEGWRDKPFGGALFFDGHLLSRQPVLAVFSLALTFVVRLLLLPVAPLVLPRRLSNLRRALLWSATSRPPILISYLWALFGALTHVVLDSFTHNDGFVVERVPFFRQIWFTIGPRELATYTLLQVGLSALLGLWGLVAFWKWSERPRRDLPVTSLTRRGRWLVWGGAAVGISAGVPVAIARYGVFELGGEQIKLGISVVFMTWSWIALTGLLVGCLLARGQRRARSSRAAPVGGDAPPQSAT